MAKSCRRLGIALALSLALPLAAQASTNGLDTPSSSVPLLFSVGGSTYMTLSNGGSLVLSGAATVGSSNGIVTFTNDITVDNLATVKGAFTVAGATTLGGNLTLNNSSAAVYAPAFYQTSDARLKTNIKTEDGLAIVEKLRGVSFDWKDGTGHSNGVLAQDVQKVMPSAVREAPNGHLTVEYSQLIGPMIEAIKELKTENDQLRAEIQQQ